MSAGSSLVEIGDQPLVRVEDRPRWKSFRAPTIAPLVRESLLAPTHAGIPSRVSPFRLFDFSTFGLSSPRRGLTMIELLVVITIIAILISVVAVASTSLISRARTNSTLSLLTVVTQAVEDFKREKPPVTTRAPYLKRYGPYPPDEVEVFTASGVPGANPSTGTLAPGRAIMKPDQNLGDMKFFGGDENARSLEHRDLAAMIIAIETLTESAASTLQQIPERNRKAGAQISGKPAQYLDRAGTGSGAFDANDHEVRYIVDDWGIPLGYMAQRDWLQNPPPVDPNVASSNHQQWWNQTSTELVQRNGGAPVIFSWGADGKDQLTSDAMGEDGSASIIGDWMDTNSPQQLNHPMNADNVYANQALKEKLSQTSQ